MNYILEIKAFYDWLEVNRLPTSAIVLWHALMHIANKTGWKDHFTVAVVVLEIKTGLKKQAVMNARTILQNKGLLSFTSRSGNQSASYKLHPFVPFKQLQEIKTNSKHLIQKQQFIQEQLYAQEQMQGQEYIQEQTQEYTQEQTQEYTQEQIQGHTQEQIQGHTQGHTINKQNEIKQNKTNLKEKVESAGKSVQSPSFSFDSFEYKASAYLRDYVLSVVPKAKVPHSPDELQKWALHIDRMKRLDKMSEEDIRNLIHFATTDPFWQNNIFSTQKLREKKDVLYAQMKSALQKKKLIQNTADIDFSGMPKGMKGIYDWMIMENFKGECKSKSE